MRRAMSWLCVLVACALAAGCAGDYKFALQKAGRHVTVDALLTLNACTGSVQGTTITATCTVTDSTSGGVRASSFTLTGLSSGDTLQLVPFAVFELPADATNFTGTYDNRHGNSGALRITPGLPSVQVDASTTLIAEPGTQLVIAELPPGSNADTYFLVASYDASARTAKALSAVRVVASGTAYIVPIVPCTSSFATVPTVTVPDGGNEVPIDVSRAQQAYVGCTSKSFVYAGASSPNTVTLIEYYNAQLDHYFVTWLPAEIAALDAGTSIKGWQRTGVTIKVYATTAAGLSAVCRFYIPPGLGDSHFFGRGGQECAQTGQKFPAFVLEDPAFFFVALPSNGTCPAGTLPIYRVFDNRPDANHRYMIDPAIRTAMVARGWIAEGDGVNLVVMCGPT